MADYGTDMKFCLQGQLDTLKERCGHKLQNSLCSILRLAWGTWSQGFKRTILMYLFQIRGMDMKFRRQGQVNTLEKITYGSELLSAP